MKPHQDNFLLTLEVEKNKLKEIALLKKLHVDFSLYSDEEVKQILKLVVEFKNIFSDEPSVTNIVEHKINTGDANPINSAPYRCSPKEREAIREKISKMLKDRIIQP